jgi:magnesium transporter
MIHVDVCEGGRSVTRGVGAERIGEHLGSPERLLWVDVAAPTDDDWDRLTAEFGFHPLAVEDAKQRSERPKMDAYEGFLFLSVRAWTGDRSRTADLDDATEEIDVFLGPNYLVTAHAAAVPLIEEMRRRWEEHPERLDSSPSTLLHVLLDTIVDDFFPAMDAIDGSIDDIEMRAYAPEAGQDAADLAGALRLKKCLLLLRQVVAPMRDILNQLLRADNPLIPARERVYYQDVYDHTLRLVEQIDLHRDILGGVMDAVMAQTNNRLNQIMKTLTAVSTSLMTAGLIAGIYGMNFTHMPELTWLYGYPAALLLMIVVVGGLLAYFRRIKWL